MARLNIEHEWFSDPRRTRLAEILGNQYIADGTAMKAWMLAQRYWFKKELVPEHAWSGSGLGEELFVCGLAERRPEGIYVRGASRHFEWYFDKCEILKNNASKGGKKSAEARLKKYGTSQPDSKLPKQIEPSPEANSSKSNPSSSSSSSSSNTKNIYIPNSIEVIKSAIEEWGTTLKQFGINKDPRLDEIPIGRLIARYGLDQTILALRGSRLEPKSDDYDPSKFCSITRVANPKNFDRFVNLGAQERILKRKELESSA